MVLPRAISQHDRFKIDVLESFEPIQPCHLRIEAPVTEALVTVLHGSSVDDVVDGRHLTTTLATDLLVLCAFSRIHAQKA